MQKKYNVYSSPNKTVWITTTCILLVVMGCFLFHMYDFHLLYFLLLVGGLIAIRVLPFARWTYIDICIGIITLYDLISCFYAECPLPAIRVSMYSLYAMVAYLTFRRLLSWQPSECIVRLGSNVLIGIALVLALLSFFIFRKSVLEAGFDDTYHFRFMFRPLGYITNVWSEVLLLILGWVCLTYRRYSVVFIFLIFTAIFLSFSRGAYIASFIYLSGSLLFMYKADKLRIIFPALVSLALVAVFCPKEVQTTLEMNRTVSQQQSTESRIHGSYTAWTTFKSRPLVGYGIGNYMYALDRITGQDSTKAFTSMPPNTLVRLIVEKGITGFLLYALLFLAVARSIWKQRTKRESRIIGCALLALIAKDMSQSAWGEIPFLMLMTYFILAYLQKNDVKEQECIPFTASCYVVVGFALTAVLVCNVPYILNVSDPTGIYLEKKDYRKAWIRHPGDIQLQYMYATRTLLKEDTSKADSMLRKLATDFPKNSLYLRAYAERCYANGARETACKMMAEAIRYSPRLLDDERMHCWKQTDSIFHSSVVQKVLDDKPTNSASASDYARYGYLAHWTGDTLTANAYLRKALKMLPNLATPYLLLGEYDKYKLLMYGAFHADLKHASLPKYPKINEDYLLEKHVFIKFRNWYEEKLYIGAK